MVVSNQQFTRGALSNLLGGIQDAREVSLWRDLLEIVPSTDDSETYDTFSPPGSVQEDLGAGFAPETGKSFNYTLTNKDWKVATEVKTNALDDDRVDGHMRRIRQMGMRVANFQFERAMVILTTGDANAGPDGSNFFANSHNDATTLDNALTSAAAAGDAVPTLAEFETEWAKIRASFTKFTDTYGVNFHYDTSGIICAVGSDLQTVAEQVFDANLSTQGRTQIFQGKAKILLLPAGHNQDTSTVKEIFALMPTPNFKPLLFQERSPVQEVVWEDKKQEIMGFGVKQRFEVGYYQPASAIHHVFTT